MTISETALPLIFTHAQAAAACGISPRTLTRRIARGFDGIVKDEKGNWQITVEALIAAGLDPQMDRAKKIRPETDSERVLRLEDQIVELEASRDIATRDASAAQSRVNDLERALDNAENAIKISELALRMLPELAIKMLDAGTAVVAPVEPITPPKRLHWWNR